MSEHHPAIVDGSHEWKGFNHSGWLMSNKDPLGTASEPWWNPDCIIGTWEVVKRSRRIEVEEFIAPYTVVEHCFNCGKSGAADNVDRGRKLDFNWMSLYMRGPGDSYFDPCFWCFSCWMTVIKLQKHFSECNAIRLELERLANEQIRQTSGKAAFTPSDKDNSGPEETASPVS